MEEQSPTRRVLVAVVEGRRQRGRPKLRWEDGVMEDARKLGERNWRNAARNRDSWQKLLKKALVQKGLLCQWWWWWLLNTEVAISLFTDKIIVVCNFFRNANTWAKTLIYCTAINTYKCYRNKESEEATLCVMDWEIMKTGLIYS